jgi:predicted MFS family arabinose efflux permease
MQTSWLAPFRVMSFRLQWPATLITVWALEMEVLILGWYVLVETGSVMALTLFGASFYFGTLIAPMLGVFADRIGHCNTLVLMRAWYAALAATLLALALTASLTPAIVLGLAILNGLVRPSDLAVRSAFMAGILPRDLLMAAMALERTTLDSARISGALVGAGLFAAVGIGATYVVIVLLYVAGALLTIAAGRAAPKAASAEAAPQASVAIASPVSFWRELREGVAFVWSQPVLRAAIWLAVLVNLTAYPLSNGLLPYAAREVYLADERGLSFLVASFAGGALVGSFTFSTSCRRLPLARLMLASAAVWYAMLVAFAQMTHLLAGMTFLFLAGLAQSLCMIAMVVLILRTTAVELTGRVMGVRILAIYSLPVGLIAAGWLIERIGFAAMASTYALFGLAMVLVLAARFHGDLWRVEAPANAT